MRDDLVSIIVPFYNAEATIERCLNSILNQTYKNIEIILIDDGSEDQSYGICKYFAQKDSRVKIFRQSNHGPAHARNRGIRESNGNWIQFIDADDVIKLNMTETLIKSTRDVELVICGYQKGKQIFLPHLINRQEKHTVLEQFGRLYKDIIFPSCCNKLYNRKIIQKYNLHFSESLTFGEDLTFNLNYLTHCQYILFIQQALYCYIKNEKSLTHSYIPNLFAQQQHIYMKLKNFLAEQHGCTNNNIQIINTLTAKNIIYTISNLLHPSSPFSKKEIQTELEKVVYDPFTQNQLNYFPDHFQYKLVKKWIKQKKLRRLIYFIKGKEWLRGNLQFVFHLLKILVSNRGEL